MGRRSSSANFEVFSQVDCIKFFSAVLKSVQLKEPVALFCFSSQGLKVTSEDAKSVQLNAFLPLEVFEEYRLNTDGNPVKFRLQLNVLIECLELFSEGKLLQDSRPRMVMTYEQYGAPLCLSVEEPVVSTDCKIKTLEPDEPVDFHFDLSDSTGKMILKSEVLKEAFSELDSTADKIKIEILVDPPTLRLVTNGSCGRSQTDIQANTEYVEMFSYQEKVDASYHQDMLKLALKPLGISKRTSLRIDERGILCLQFMIQQENDKTGFVEFYCSPELLDDESE
ncbi:cell cycle checkpoint protein RAD1-like [Artemia franciscana]|uniref:Cell cycle checkpoint protein RAD1 n=1 Tax=Artemia franciscana TaxID=6661 RepID=A0AA88HMZ1_ARTSF|nr:hypothetical protein QYM36_011987 [Artemia franciscana]